MLSHRRRMLLTLASFGSFHYESQHYDFLRNSLVPSLLNSYYVDDKVKRAKISKIYANGVIENQFNRWGDFPDNTTFTITEPDYMSSIVSNNKMTCSLLQNISSGTTTTIYDGYYLQNHKYLISAVIKSIVGDNTIRLGFSGQVGAYIDTPTINVNKIIKASGFITPISNSTNCIVRFQGSHSAGNSFEISEYEIIDLTLRYGTGNEPTTLTDNRIQALLNRGYIDYNVGEYKSTDISEFVSEPYNLLSLDRTQGVLNGGSYTKDNQQNFDENKYYAGLAVNDYIHQTAVSNVSINGDTISFTTNSFAYGLALPIKVIAGREYTLEKIGTNAGVCYVCWYNENGYFISSISAENNVSITAPNNAYWGVIVLRGNSDGATASYSNICLHLTGTRTGYAPHKTLSPLSFKYQGNGAIDSHDTLEKTDTEWVFTKSSVLLDLGEATWTHQTTGGGSGCYTTSFANKIKASTINYLITTNKYHKGTGQWSDQNSIWVGSSSAIGIADFDFSEGYQLKDFLSQNNVKMICELATPQVIRIPRKHLAIVDLGSLTYSLSSNGYFTAKINNQKVYGINSNECFMYCSKYMTYSNANRSSNERGINMGYTGDTSWTIRIKDTSITSDNATILQNALSGTYLFYETQDEVADIDNTIQVEVGGTITSDSNVLPNVDVEYGVKDN